MIRVVVAAVLIVLLWLGLTAAIRILRRNTIDWSGVAFAIGFVMLALWLHHVTGAGLLFG